MGYNYNAENRFLEYLEEEKKKKQATVQKQDQRSRTVERNRRLADVDPSYVPAGVSRPAYDALRSGSYTTATEKQTRSKSAQQRSRGLISDDKKQNTRAVEKSNYRTRGLYPITLPTPLPSVAQSHISTAKKTFADDAAQRRKTYETTPKIKDLFGRERKATALDLMKRPAEEHTPVDYDTVERISARRLAELSNQKLRAEGNPALDPSYTPEQRRSDIARIDREYSAEEAFLKQIRAERRSAETYRAAETANDFEKYAEAGRRKSNPNYSETLGKPILGNKQFGVSPINNKVEYAFASKNFLLPDGSYAARTLHGTDAKYLMMTDTERATYNYYLGKGYATTAEDYLNSIDNTLTARLGKVLADRTVNDGNAARKAFNAMNTAADAGLERGVQGFGEAFGRAVLLDDTPYTQSAMQQTYGQLRPRLDGALGVAADVANSVGNMIPSVAVGAFAGPLAGAAAMGVSTGGSAYADARREGKTDEQAGKYAVLEGGKEALMSYLLSGIGSLGKAGASTALSKIPALNKAAQAIGKAADKLKVNPKVQAAFRASGKYLANMADEGLEEYIQEVLEPVVRNIAFDENNGLDLLSEEAIYAGALGAITAGLVNASNLPEDYKNSRLNAKIDAYNEALQEYQAALASTATTAHGRGFYDITEIQKESADSTTRGVNEVNPPPATKSALSNSTIPQPLPDVKDTAPAADVADGKAIHVGKATTIYHPYEGATPTNMMDYPTKTVILEQSILDKAQRNMDYAAMSNVKSRKSALKEIYNGWFDSRKNNNIMMENVIFENQPYIVSLGKKAVGKVISDPNISTAKIAIFDVVDDIIRNGEYVGSGQYIQKGKKNKLTKRFDYFETPVQIGKNDYIVAFDVEVFPNVNNYRTHKVINKMELKQIVGADVGPVPTADTNASVPASTIPQPLPDVKQGINADEPPINIARNQMFDSTNVDINGAPVREILPLPDIPATTMDAKDKNDEYKAQRQKKTAESQNISFMIDTPKNKKPFRKKASEIKSEISRKLVDSGDAVRAIGKTSKDKHLYAYFNNARQAQAAGQYMVTKAQTDIYGKTVGKSLDEVFAPIKSKGEQYQRDFTEFLLHRHNIDRWRANRPIDFTDDFELPKSQDIVKRHLKNHPEFRDLAEDVYAFNRNLMQYRVDAGLITKEFARDLNEQYPHYVPTHREFDNDYYPINTMSEEIARVGTGINKAEGGPGAILPIYDQMSKAAVQTVSQAKRNIFANRLADIVYNDPMGMSGWANMPKDAEGIYNLGDLKGDSLKDNILVYHRNGKTEAMEIGRPLMEAVRELTNQGREVTEMERAFRKVNTAYKSLITEYNPLFTVRNFARDFPDALFASKDTAAFIRYLPEAVNEIRKGGELWQQFEALGGTQSSFFDYDYSSGTFKKQSGLKRQTLGRISEANRFVEMVPRFTEFYATVKKGDGSYANLMDAVHNAADITVNFQRGGSWVKPLNSTIFPYLNASMQGVSKNIRTFTETSGIKAWARLAIKAAVLGFAPKLINEFLLGDDEQYKELQDHDKMNNFVIKYGDNQFIKIPTGRLTGVLGSLSSATLRAVRGGEVDVADLVLNAASQVGPVNPLEQNIFSAIIGTANNRTWYGGEIENERLQGLPVVERYDNKTSEIGKGISRAINGFAGLSPKKIDYLIDSYTGVLGDVALPLFTNPENGNVSADDRAKSIGYKAFVEPWEKKFLINGNVSNNVSSNFYEKADELTQTANSQDAVIADKITLRYYNSKNEELGNLHRRLRSIESNTNISSFKRKELAESVQREIDSLQRSTMKDVNRYRREAEKYNKEDKDIAYLLTNRDVFGAEYALQEAGDSVYEKAQEAVQNGASYENYVDYTRRLWALPKSVKEDSERYAAEKANIIRSVEWKDRERYIISTMSESKQKKYTQVKKSFGRIDAVNYHKIVEGYNKIEGIKGSNGKTITGTKKANQIKYLQSVGFNYGGAVLFRKILESN